MLSGGPGPGLLRVRLLCATSRSSWIGPRRLKGSGGRIALRNIFFIDVNRRGGPDCVEFTFAFSAPRRWKHVEDVREFVGNVFLAHA